MQDSYITDPWIPKTGTKEGIKTNLKKIYIYIPLLNSMESLLSIANSLNVFFLFL